MHMPPTLGKCFEVIGLLRLAAACDQGKDWPKSNAAGHQANAESDSMT